MTPIKAKTLIKEVAKETQFSEKDCDKVITYFYKYIRENLSNLRHKKIEIDNFGSFYVKERTLKDQKTTYEQILRHLEKKEDSYRKERIIDGVSSELERVNKIQDLYKKDRERRKEFYIKKRGYYEENNGTLEQS